MLILISCLLGVLAPALANNNNLACGDRAGKTDWTEAQLISLSPQCFSRFYAQKIHDGAKLSSMINQRISIYKKLLQEIESNNFRQVRADPVVKWAQSKDQIFISFKLSHRQDSPTCSDIKSENFEVVDIPIIQCPFEIKARSTKPKKITFGSSPSNNTEPQIEGEKILTYFTYQSQCYLTQQRITFYLNLTFNDTVNRISIRKQAIGSYTVIGYKQTEGIWVTPFANQHELSIWSEMRQKYGTDMDEYFRLLQEKHQKEQQKPKKKRRRRKPKQVEPDEGEKEEQRATNSDENEQNQDEQL